jgi:hypothetical protein
MGTAQIMLSDKLDAAADDGKTLDRTDAMGSVALPKEREIKSIRQGQSIDDATIYADFVSDIQLVCFFTSDVNSHGARTFTLVHPTLPTTDAS